MISIPTGIRAYTPGCAEHADDPPTFMMDAIAQRQHDEAAGYSSLDPRTLARPSSGLIDVLENSHRQRLDGGELPPRRGVNIDGKPVRMAASDGFASASGHGAGRTSGGSFFDRFNPFRSAHSRAESARNAAVSHSRNQMEADIEQQAEAMLAGDDPTLSPADRQQLSELLRTSRDTHGEL